MAIKTASKPKAVKGKSSNPKPKRGTGAKGDTVEIIRSYLFEMHKMGIDSVEESEILSKTGYARSDSRGYREAKNELTKGVGHVSKSQGRLALTQQGLDYLAANGTTITVAPVTMAEHQAELLERLVQNAGAPASKVQAFWNVLLDGKDHSHKELLSATGYQRTDSKGYRNIHTWFGQKKLGLLEKAGKNFQFADKVYRFGERPN